VSFTDKIVYFFLCVMITSQGTDREEREKKGEKKKVNLLYNIGESFAGRLRKNFLLEKSSAPSHHAHIV
jgi:hypothetical protein